MDLIQIAHNLEPNKLIWLLTKQGSVSSCKGWNTRVKYNITQESSNMEENVYGEDQN